MATTTNYGWTTPDNTALVKDGASAIRTLGSSVDTTVKALSPGTTSGDVDYYTSSTAKARLGIGSTGQVLTVAGGVPSWATPVSGYANVQVFNSSTTWTVPAGITRCAVYAVAGGGGGGSGAIKITSGVILGGNGGNPGLVGFDPFFTVTPAASITVTIGAGGTGGTAVSGNAAAADGVVGGDGTASSFDTLTTGTSAGGARGTDSGVANTTPSENNSNFISAKVNTAGRSLSGSDSSAGGIYGVTTLMTQSGSTGSAGSNATVGTTLGTGGAASNAGFGGGGGGGGGTNTSSTLKLAGAGNGGGGGGGAGAASATNITTTAGAGGAGATNKGGGGGGGGGATKVGSGGATVTSGAGGNGGSGVIVILY
jgi:hypothetical protein